MINRQNLKIVKSLFRHSLIIILFIFLQKSTLYEKNNNVNYDFKLCIK
jgi:hypothetical protein